MLDPFGSANRSSALIRQECISQYTPSSANGSNKTIIISIDNQAKQQAYSPRSVALTPNSTCDEMRVLRPKVKDSDLVVACMAFAKSLRFDRSFCACGTTSCCTGHCRSEVFELTRSFRRKHFEKALYNNGDVSVFGLTHLGTEVDLRWY